MKTSFIICLIVCLLNSMRATAPECYISSDSMYSGYTAGQYGRYLMPQHIGYTEYNGSSVAFFFYICGATTNFLTVTGLCQGDTTWCHEHHMSEGTGLGYSHEMDPSSDPGYFVFDDDTYNTPYNELHCNVQELTTNQEFWSCGPDQQFRLLEGEDLDKNEKRNLKSQITYQKRLESYQRKLAKIEQIPEEKLQKPKQQFIDSYQKSIQKTMEKIEGTRRRLLEISEERRRLRFLSAEETK